MELKCADGVNISVQQSTTSPAPDHALVVQQRSLDEANLMSDNMSKSLQKERQLLQEKMYTSWLNYRLKQVPGSPQIGNLFEDLRNGKYLLALLELLTGQKLKLAKGEMRVHHLNNLAKVFKVLSELNIKLVGIHNENICDGQIISTLGLCWSIIYHFQVLQSVDQTATQGNAEKALLEWCREIAKSYVASDVKSFQPNRWKTGYMLNAIIHSFNPKLFQYHNLTQFNDAGRVQHALELAYNHYQVPQLFSATDFENNLMDNKTLVLYVSMLREKMNMDKDKGIEVLTLLKRLQGELNDLKKTVENKEACDLINPPSNLSFGESKKFSGQYKGFEKELDDVSTKLKMIKEEVKSSDSTSNENKDKLNADCEELQNRVNNLKEKGKACHEDVKQRRINVVKDKLVNVTKNVATLKDETEKVAEKLTPDASKEVLAKCESICKDLLQRLAQMQSTVKGTCALVDEAYADKLLQKDIRQGLKNDAISVLDEYAKLMVSLETQQNKASTLHGNKVKETEDKFSSWADRVKELDVWLSERINKYENMLIKYGSVGHLKEVNTQNKQLSKEIGESWRTFEGIAVEWNSELCDELNDDKYADVLTDIQIKFNKLNEVATGTKTLINGMLNQKRTEDELVSKLLSWKAYVDGKEKELSADTDVTNTESYHTHLEGILKEIDEKDNDVKSFLASSNNTLQKNKYDENSILQIETDLKVFCDKWDQLKETCKQRKLRVEQLTQTQIIQKESERNLVESLADWQRILDDYTSRLNHCDIDESFGLQEINMAIEELEALITDIHGQDGKLKEYDRNSQTLINTLEHDNASRLNVDFQLFFKHWEDLTERSNEVRSRLKDIFEQLLANEHSIMGERESKDMVTEEWLNNVSEEINVYCEPENNIDDFEDYLSKFEELESKVNSQGDLVDGNITDGTNLAESDKLHLEENKEKIKQVVNAFTQKKSALQQNLIMAKKMVDRVVEKQRVQKENEQNLQDGMSGWKKILEDNTDTLDRCDVNEICDISDTQKAIDILEALLAEIGNNDDKLYEFDANSQELLNTLAPEKAAQLTLDFKLFFKSWDHCKDKTNERLSGLKMQLGQLQKNEDNLMGEWDCNALKTHAWLEEAEKETALYCTLPDDLHHIQTFLSNFEELVNKVNSKLESIAEQKEHGNAFIESEKVQQKENKEKIQNDLSTFDEKEAAVHENVSNAKKLIEDQIRVIVLKKLEDFWAWLPTVQKRSEEGDEIGPDFETVNKQIQEMKVIEGQALQISFSGLLDDDNSGNISEFLTDEDKSNLKSANDEWTTIKNWVDKRLETLERSEDQWEDFKARKVDLGDYLRDIENELKSASGLDLNDSVTVESRTGAFETVTAGMETRKYHVANLVEIADTLIDLIGSDTKSESESTLPNSIRSQVADILDSWNSMVKRSIELKTKLLASCKKFETLENVFGEVHGWVDNVNDILNKFTVDACGEYIDELRVSLEEKQEEEEGMKRKLDEVNEIDKQLSEDGEISSQYTLDGDITELNEDFTLTSIQLEELRKFRGKARILSRRVRGGTRHFFTGIHDRTKEAVSKKPIESAS